MKLEIWLSRGLRIEIDGERTTAKNWGFEGGKNVGDRMGDIECYVPSYDKGTVKHPLPIGKHLVTGITFGEGEIPEQLTLITTDAEIPMRVVTDATQAEIITVNGKKEFVDEITLYLRAQTADDNDSPGEVKPWDSEAEVNESPGAATPVGGTSMKYFVIDSVADNIVAETDVANAPLIPMTDTCQGFTIGQTYVRFDDQDGSGHYIGFASGPDEKHALEVAKAFLQVLTAYGRI